MGSKIQMWFYTNKVLQHLGLTYIVLCSLCAVYAASCFIIKINSNEGNRLKFYMYNIFITFHETQLTNDFYMLYILRVVG